LLHFTNSSAMIVLSKWQLRKSNVFLKLSKKLHHILMTSTNSKPGDRTLRCQW
jgi:membrane protein CcdC involved in cytochrome C biogenesis